VRQLLERAIAAASDDAMTLADFGRFTYVRDSDDDDDDDDGDDDDDVTRLMMMMMMTMTSPLPPRPSRRSVNSSSVRSRRRLMTP
jgi:hypothetical protein